MLQEPADGPLASTRGPEAALEASEARFRNLIESNADGILVVRPDGMIRYANPAATELLRRPAPELVGRYFGIPIGAGGKSELDLVSTGAAAQVVEMRVGETEWKGEPALLASLRDISDRKRLEEQLRYKVEELAVADQRKDEFLAMLAHELRNPLAPILNAVHIMRPRGDDAVLRERLRVVVEQQVRCMARLVDDLLDVSRITRGKIRLRHEPVVLSTLVQRSLETLRPHLVAKGHELRVSLPDEPIRLWADPVRLEQVLNNLLTNAIKYTESGGLVEVEAASTGEEVAIRVRDNGIGIAPDMLEGIFGLFTQVDQSLARSQGGLGIGLTLARDLVRMHEGSLTARSAGLGKGSEFIVTLPLSNHVGDVVTSPTAVDSRPTGSLLRVLVVDDNQASADSLGLIIKLWGHDCRVTHAGPEAVEEADVFGPDVVLLDIGLPGMDGHAVARELRSRPHLAGVVLIAMTGYAREEDRERSRDSGFNEHLVKPLDLDALELLLAQVGDSDREAASPS